MTMHALQHTSAANTRPHSRLPLATISPGVIADVDDDLRVHRAFLETLPQ